MEDEVGDLVKFLFLADLLAIISFFRLHPWQPQQGLFLVAGRVRNLYILKPMLTTIKIPIMMIAISCHIIVIL